MKSQLDKYWNNFQEVQHERGLYGANDYKRLDLVFPKGLEDAIFEQNPYIDTPRYSFLIKGYEGLTAITDINIIKQRQLVIQAFANSMNEESRFQTIFNNFHLLEKLVSRQLNRDRHSLSENANYLLRYGQEVDALVSEMSKHDNILGELSNHYKNRYPALIIDNVVRACRKGSFDYVVMEIEPRKLKKWGGRRKESEKGVIRLHGVMGMPNENIKGQVLLRGDKTKRIGIETSHLVSVAVGQSFQWLNRIYSPLSALFSEAFYLKNNDVCLPQINEEGVFEMVNGRPIMPTPNPVGTSLYYDKNSAKVVLNGIHSGGKSHLLKTIASYHLIGLRGFPVPAQSAQIPIVKRILHSFDVEKRSRGGSLESEFFDRAKTLNSLGEEDLVLMDEFLQHASPDASTDLEPIILGDFYKTGASVIVVTHRGDSLDDKDQWQFYSPGFKEENGRIIPTFKFQPGRPNQEILRRHAKQMLQDALNHTPIEEKKSEDRESSINMADFHDSQRWYNSLSERLLNEQFDSKTSRNQRREF